MISTGDLLQREVDISARCVGNVDLIHFRNFSELHVSLGKGFNVIAGPNGQGKTNFLEALHLAATTRLLRGQKEVEAIEDDHSVAEVGVEIRPALTTISCHLERGARKRVSLNGMRLPRAADVLGRLSCVCISSEDMEIVRGEPAVRRLFMDLELSGRSPGYLRHLTVYKRALEQRNALLRQARECFVKSELWEVWEEQLAAHGSAIRTLRAGYLAEIRKCLPQLHKQIGRDEPADIQLILKDEIGCREEAVKALELSREADIGRGATSLGPHRDDIELLVQGRSARLFGSQGQQRTLVIALKLATLQLGTTEEGEPPLLLLDDILSDLDLNRRQALVQVVLQMAGQTVLTCTEPEGAGSEILNAAEIFSVQAGRMHKAG